MLGVMRFEPDYGHASGCIPAQTMNSQIPSMHHVMRSRGMGLDVEALEEANQRIAKRYRITEMRNLE